MDAAARHVIKKQKTSIKEKLYLSDSILDKLEETDTINEEISQKVKAERTNEEKIDKLLYHLKRRGREAFQNFVDAVKSDPVYKSLARDLEMEYYKATRLTEKDCKSPDKQDTVKDIPDSPAFQTISSLDSLSYLEPVRQLRLQQDLSILYTRLKAHMTSGNMRELSFKSPQPVTFKMVIELQDEYLKTVDECYETLGVKDKTKSLRSHIVDLKANEKKLKSEVKEKEHQRNRLSHQYIKLENKHSQITVGYRTLDQNHQKLTKQMEELQLTLTDTTEKLDKVTEENAKLKQKLKNEEKRVINQEPQDTDFSDCDTNSPRRVNRHVQRRRSTGISFQSRNFVSPKREYNQQFSQEQGTSTLRMSKESDKFNIEKDYKNNPQVKFALSGSGSKGKSGNSSLAALVIGNVASKVPKLEAEPESETNESPSNVKKRNNGKKQIRKR